MSWIDDVAAAVSGEVFQVGTITDAQGVSGSHTLKVSWGGMTTGVPAQWSSAFDIVWSVKGNAALIGIRVLVAVAQGQPVVSDMLVGS